jgi:hypothetical protein
MLLILFACVTTDETGDPFASTDAPITCADITVETDDQEYCTIAFDTCSDDIDWTLECYETSGHMGATSGSLLCSCARNGASYGATELKGGTCGAIEDDTDLIAAGFQACGTDLVVE